MSIAEKKVLLDDLLLKLLKGFAFPFSFIITDTKERVLFISKSCVTHIQHLVTREIPTDTFVGKKLSMIIPSLTCQIKNGIEVAISGGVKEFSDIRIPSFCKTSCTWFNVSCFSLAVEKHARYIVICLNDITNDRNIQIELEKSISNLEKSNKKLERFTYICSHDIKEPLRSISNFIQLIQKHNSGHADPLTQDYLQHALTNVNRLQKLVQNILHYAHVTNANVFYEKVPLDKILLDVLESLREKIQSRDAHIEISPLPCVYGDPTHFTQLFSNIIDNALKFHASTPPHIQIYTTENQHEWSFYIKDNGIGIPPIYHQKIFNVFERLHDRRLYDGSGIGLSICEEIVETYGGKIWVESDGNSGSCFIFVLPKSLTKHKSSQTPLT